MYTVFVTGGTGFIGSHFVNLLHKQGHRVFALRRQGSRPRIALDSEPTWIDGDYNYDHHEVLANCDSFVHFAAYGVSSNSNDWSGCLLHNVSSPIRLWIQAISTNIKRFLIIGSCFEYGLSSKRYDFIPCSASLEPTTAYAFSKASASMAAHSLSIHYKLSTVIARPFHVYGDGEAIGRLWPSLRSAALSCDDFPMTTGEQIRDFQPVESTVDQLLNWLDYLYTDPLLPFFINLGTGNPQSLLAFAQSQWRIHNAKGRLLPGLIPHRIDEIWRCVPQVTSLPQYVNYL